MRMISTLDTSKRVVQCINQHKQQGGAGRWRAKRVRYDISTFDNLVYRNFRYDTYPTTLVTAPLPPSRPHFRLLSERDMLWHEVSIVPGTAALTESQAYAEQPETNYNCMLLPLLSGIYCRYVLSRLVVFYILILTGS